MHIDKVPMPFSCSSCGELTQVFRISPSRKLILDDGFWCCKTCLQKALLQIEIIETKEKDNDVSRC